ncbi:MAG TPA: helix-turn-helix transcriptional regulator [Allosphingosinicella sp.]|jgi:transcriptional regulator with XRE-family HTH domain|nr:helix-turn-helix transcriptional regulator [Allosphingosinicella sp.]
MLREEWLDARRTEEIARRVREELARRRISRQALADTARISISTLEKALSGRRAFTLATVIRLEEALGTGLRGPLPAANPAQDFAPEELGGYGRAASRWIEGCYVTLRPLFGEERGIHAFMTTIRWEAALKRLVFEESERADSFAQRGSVALPLSSGHIYLITSEEGQYRLAILGRPTISRSLYGILTTLIIGHGSQLVPAACPLALLRIGEGMSPAFGRIAPDHPAFSAYRAELEAVGARDFVRFPGVP